MPSEKIMPSEIKVTFRYNRKTGEMIELLVDDGYRYESEGFHDEVTASIAKMLLHNPEFRDIALSESHENSQVSRISPSGENPLPEGEARTLGEED